MSRLIFLIVIALTLAAGCRGRVDPDAAPISTISLSDQNGTPHKLAASGKVSLINFWATWCGPCIAEMPDLQELADSHSRDSLIIVGISTDRLPLADIVAFANEVGVSYPIVKDDGSAEESIGGLLGLPTTIILDRRGRLAHRILGASTLAELERHVAALLKDDH